MEENFFEEFICFIETYIDEQIVKEDEYKQLIHKCSELSYKVQYDSSLEGEYKNAGAELDLFYRNALCRYTMKCIAVLMNKLGIA